MQKIVNGIAIASGVISLTVVGTIGYVFIRKDAIIENVKGKIMEAVMPSMGGAIQKSLPEANCWEILVEIHQRYNGKK